jgi:hypothetical protein
MEEQQKELIEMIGKFDDCQLRTYINLLLQSEKLDDVIRNKLTDISIIYSIS